MELRITRVSWEADGVVGLRLTAVNDRPLPTWEPGAHLDLRLPSGLARQYSLCGDPEDATGYEIAVRLEDEGRGGSAEIHNSPLVGRRVVVSEVRNHFRLVPAQEYLFVAGGIGITPLLPMVRQLGARGPRWSLIYSGRGVATMPFREQLAAIAGERLRIVDTEQEPRPDLEAVIAGLGPDAVVYCCGPNSMLEAVTDLCERAGVRCETEHFGAAVREEDATPGEEVELELRRSGVTVVAGPDTSLLEAIRSAGVDIESDCEEGYCGTCETRVLEGVPDHRDVVLSKAERAAGKTFFPCVSRACGARLVVDL